MPVEPVRTALWRYHDRKQRRRVILGWVVFALLVFGTPALIIAYAWSQPVQAEFGSNLDRGYDRATGGVGVSVGGGDRPTDDFGDPVSGGSPRDKQPFGARSGGGGLGANDHVGSGGSNSNDVGQGRD